MLLYLQTFVAPAIPTPPPLAWPRVRMDRFDSRSIIIWMLIAIGLAFAGLRIARQLIDRREQHRRLKKLRAMVSYYIIFILYYEFTFTAFTRRRQRSSAD